MDLFKLVGTIAIDNSSAESAISETTSSAESMSSKIGSKFQAVGSKMTSLGKSLAPVSAGVVAFGGAMVATAKKTADHTDQIDKMSQKLGISRKAYQEWDYILSQNGASIDSMKMGMKTLNTQLDSVAQKGDTTGSAFERLGLSWDDLKGMSQEEVFETTIRALQGVEDETERTALANKLLGRSGMELAPLLNSGAEATDKLRQKAHDLGMVLDDETIDAGVNMTDAMDTLKRTFATIGYTIGGAVMPYITKFCNYASSNLPKVRDFVKVVAEKIDSIPAPIKKVIGVILAVLAVASPALIIGGKIISFIGTLIGSIGKVIGVITKVAGVAKALFSLLLANPIALVIVGIVALVAGLIYAYKHSEKFRKFVQKLWTVFKASFTKIKTIVTTVIQVVVKKFTEMQKNVKDILKKISDTIKKVFDTIKKTIQTVLNAIKTIFTTAWKLIKTGVTLYFKAYYTVIKTTLTLIKTVITTVLNAIKTVFTNAWKAIKTTVTNAIAAIKTKVTEVMNTVKSNVTSKLNDIKSAFTSKFNDIKSTVSSKMNDVKSTINSKMSDAKSSVSSKLSDMKSSFSSKFSDIKSTVSSKMSDIKSSITSKIADAKKSAVSSLAGIASGFGDKLKSAKSTVDSWIKKIKGALKFSWSLPKLKIPHISVSGGKAPWGIGGKGTPPSFSVGYWKKAIDQPYNFSDATLFGFNPVTGTAHVAGEGSQDEMLYGRENLMRDIGEVTGEQQNQVVEVINAWFTRLFELCSEWFPQFATDLVLDTGALVASTAPQMDAELGRIMKRKGRK